MKRLGLLLWLIASALLLLLCLALAYMSLMLGAAHWDQWLSLGIAGGFVAAAMGCLWMCRQALRLLRTG
ncbi:MAG: hypothetical protein HC869_15320 [Rhodospirillales bacterium]|nr:hypothetical protein [Rhodospirillales bacterium]